MENKIKVTLEMPEIEEVKKEVEELENKLHNMKVRLVLGDKEEDEDNSVNDDEDTKIKKVLEDEYLYGLIEDTIRQIEYIKELEAKLDYIKWMQEKYPDNIPYETLEYPVSYYKLSLENSKRVLVKMANGIEDYMKNKKY